MKNILVVFTGGTIGSIADKGTIATSAEASYQLLSLYDRQRGPDRRVHFKSIQAASLLSENLNPAVWESLIKAIESACPDQYDGVIVTHGTDTLAYTAAAFSFYFHRIKVPLLLVSSDYPLEHPKANGLENFTCAVEFIRQQIQAGVFIPYRNQHQVCQVHSGVRLACSLQLSGDFFSVQGKHYMECQDNVFTVLNSFRRPIETAKFNLSAQFAKDILMIRPYPGLDYCNFDLGQVRAVLHDLYHSGTACTSNQWGENYSLLTFIKRCRKKGVKIYLAPALKHVDAYETTRALIEQGAEMIWNMSLEAAYVKLLLAYGHFNDDNEIKAFIDTDIAGEYV